MSALLDFDLEAHREAGGSVAGVATGTVTDNQDPEQLGRVKVKLPWRADDFETDWIRIVTPMAGAGRGLYCVPEVGDEVLLAFDRNDIRYPYVLGALWSRTDKPPQSGPTSENDIRVLHTRKGHVLRFDDAKGKGAITIELNDGKKIEIDDDGIRVTDTMSTVTLDAKAGSVSIEAAKSMSLKAPQITIEASASLDLKGGAALNANAGMVRIN